MTLPSGGKVSQFSDRSDYITADTAGAPAAAGFELSSVISADRFLLIMLFAALHESVPPGAFLLLFDVAQGNIPPNGMPNGALAKFSLGPTSGNIGATIMLSESDVEPVQWIADPTCPDGRRAIRGLPFDNGCLAVLSSTIGRLTAFNAGANGMRLYARRQH